MSERALLRSSAEFRTVYGNGRRYDGRLISVFILSNGMAQHRIGITASRKMSLRAVGRNRAKRLIRETFRMSQAELDVLQSRYDWVINARRSLLSVKVPLVLEEFRRIVAQVKSDEIK
ncbi:MAG: ribonuclease P protein component [Acidobacteria bacterium]|nr:ribonuclease P protein component [Acidobacteriota bacterium]